MTPALRSRIFPLKSGSWPFGTLLFRGFAFSGLGFSGLGFVDDPVQDDALFRSLPMPSSQTPIAERTLFIVAPGGKQIPVPVRLHPPVKHSCSWSCTYEIEWPKKRKSMAIFGIDAFQALHLALQKVGSELYTSRYHADGTLMWSKPGEGYGFPVTPGVLDRLVEADRN